MKSLSVIFLLVTAFSIVSCEKDDDTTPTNVFEFRVTTSANATVKTVAYTNVEGDLKNVSEVNSSNFSATVAVNGSVKSITLSATSVAASTSGTMTVQILRGGSVVAENSTSGQTMSATTSYTVVD